MKKNAERVRLETTIKNTRWKKWGPYLSERQWGTVREDYSEHGNAWDYFSHDMARYRAYRWGEDGIGGFSDTKQFICMAFSFWNGKDPIIKERLFGLTNSEGNHGEDVKELYYYLDATPTHSYNKMLYKYPQKAFPYKDLIITSKNRNKLDQEYELIDTGIFDNNEYFDIFIEYVKKNPETILVKITAHNRNSIAQDLHVIPTIWFRNTWAWEGKEDYKPIMMSNGENPILIKHKRVGSYFLYYQNSPTLLFCDNETNPSYFGKDTGKGDYYKDAIDDYIIHDKKASVNPELTGTKVGLAYKEQIAGHGKKTFKFYLSETIQETNPFDTFDDYFSKSLEDANIFYANIQKNTKNEDLKNIQRQAYSGMLWNKQFYYYNVEEWLKGDIKTHDISPNRPQRNQGWKHLSNSNILSMPDKWEYPWYAAWDLAFHCIPLAHLDAAFAKRQILLLLRNYYMHPNGQIPAYEWSFSDVNPPLHAWAAWEIYTIDKKNNDGIGDIEFLSKVLLKLSINFTWWANQKDTDENNLFEGGFLGLDNIGVFDRNNPEGGNIEQADATSWMAMYALNLLLIAIEVSQKDHAFEELIFKFFEHFLVIAEANCSELWDDSDNFFYDYYKTSHGAYKHKGEPLRVRSLIGMIPLFATEIFQNDLFSISPNLAKRLRNSLQQRSYFAKLVNSWYQKSKSGIYILSLVKQFQMEKILDRALDEVEFLSPIGIRSLSKFHQNNPFIFHHNGSIHKIHYEPGESHSSMFGGNSNWRGPIWIPINYLFIKSLLKFHEFYGNNYKIEYPTGSGNKITLKEIAFKISKKLTSIFLPNEEDYRKVNGKDFKFQNDPYFKEHILFYEYFDGDTGKGLGASHQTGWTGLIATIIDLYYELKNELEE